MCPVLAGIGIRCGIRFGVRFGVGSFSSSVDEVVRLRLRVRGITLRRPRIVTPEFLLHDTTPSVVWPAIPYCLDLIEAAYLTTDESKVVAFRPKKK